VTDEQDRENKADGDDADVLDAEQQGDGSGALMPYSRSEGFIVHFQSVNKDFYKNHGHKNAIG